MVLNNPRPTDAPGFILCPVTNMKLEFAKLSGSGNDFVCIDNRDGKYDRLINSPPHIRRFANALCRRGLGIGADGVIFACATEVEDFSDIAARFFEADGSEVELCGNGVGCFVHWVMLNRWLEPREVKILTPAGVVRGTNSEGNYTRVCIPIPEDIRHNIELEVNGDILKCDYVVTGVPHTVTWIEDLDKLDVDAIGKLVRHHQAFAPRGVNANFVQVLDEGEIAVRTYEFGVEGETLACGTGSASAAILTTLARNWPDEYRTGKKPVLVHARSGDVLKIYFSIDKHGNVDDVCLETVIRFIFTGTIQKDLLEASGLQTVTKIDFN